MSDVGQQMHALIADLYPLCRSITGNGLRETLRRLPVPLVMHEVPTGTKVFDWTVPREWNIRDAYVKNDRGERVIDFQKHNLHVLNYSVPVQARLPLAELRKHLFTHPEWIPYRTSYYAEQWGFCLSERHLAQLPDGEYEVRIDSTLADGSLTYGEYYVPGATTDEILISCHACHPSLANDNLSGVALTTQLAQTIQPGRYSYRFLWIPGTIGAIAWLARNEDKVGRIKHGLVIAGVGDAGPVTYKKSRRGNAEIDRAAAHVVKNCREFSPYGYDERQYGSPGFNLPVGRLGRTPYGEYPEYHTSADNLEFVTPGALADSLAKVREILFVLEHNRSYRNLQPKCEPQLGRRGLAPDLALLWVLNQSDGEHDLLAIAELAGLAFADIHAAAATLEKHGLLAAC